FTNYDGLFQMDFVGIKNYQRIFRDRNFWRIFVETFKYVFIVVPIMYVVSLGLAMIVIQNIKCKGLIRGIFYWPVMISSVVVGVTWKWIFGDALGVANYIITILGQNPIPWLTEDSYAFIAVIIATVWSRAGFFMVLFIGGLNGISESYYEAAKIDGANLVQRFFKVTLPLIKPTSVLVIMLSCIESFKVYPLILSLTGGGPGRSTTYLVQYVYQTGFVKTEVGFASAMSIILFLVILVFSSIQFKLSKGGEI
ncbi:MAG: carbohydrate ABC transporter permease, partial [Cetobacterium sp.]